MADREIDYSNPAYYYNRELSWLQFDRRCLNEARSKENPVMERLNFLSITASNLDEFFMVRVASLQDMSKGGYTKRDIAGMTADEQLDAILAEAHAFVGSQYSTYNHQILPALKAEGITMVDDYRELRADEKAFLDEFFETEVYPVITPMAVDSSRPFPLILNKSLNLGALLKRKENAGPGILNRTKKSKKTLKSEKENLEFATVQVPSVLPRVIRLPLEEHPELVNGHVPVRVILLETVIREHMDQLFQSYDIVCAYPFRIMRSADMDIDEDEAEDLLKEIEKSLKQRRHGNAIRLEVEAGIDTRLLDILVEELQLNKDEIFMIDGPLDLTFLSKVRKLSGFDDLHEHRYPAPQEVPELPKGCDIFAQIRKGDIFLHHPYESFQPVVDFISRAADDPDVLAIKQTLYRVSGNSPIVAALARAADHGKQVTVLVELKARFDEENNIVWARMLEKAGAHVIYGLVGLKTHSKITLIVRREEDGIRRYVHLATGNYNDITARLYTDVGLMTCKEQFGEDATAVFNMLSGYSEPRSWNKLLLAPLWLKERFKFLIGRETQHALNGEPARIKAKMNSLCDPDIIEALYKASGAGVKIDLIVRGICCLRVGIPGISDNIVVRSIVGNFLEHSRIFWFANGGRPEIYAGSADWMPRNLDRRVEIVFPLEDPAVKEKAEHILDVELMDTMQASILQPDGTYEKVDRRGKEKINSQMLLGEEAVRTAQAAEEARRQTRNFVPEVPPTHDEVQA
ncbi:polyphosphate kinase [Lachnospiraceae bacterium NK3A20]|nr:polyphosphate kinase [Lachnospiraceae bacterium NK3A20]